MTKLTLIFMVLFLAFTNAIYAQNAFIEERPSPTDHGEDEQTIYHTVVSYYGSEIIVYYGDFDALAELPGSANLYFTNEDGNNSIFPGAKNFGAVYAVANDFSGNIVIGTDNGMYVLAGSNWDLMYDTQGHPVRLIAKSSNGKLFFVRETPLPNPDFAPTAEFMYVDDTEEHILFETNGLSSGYGEHDSTGMIVFKDGGLGTLVSSFAFDLYTMEQIVDFKPPHESEWFTSAYGYLSLAVANDKLYLAAMGPGGMHYLIVWDGNVWTEDEFRLAGQIYSIDNELYNGPYKINPTDLSFETVATIGEEMVYGMLQKFDDTWYFLSPGLSQLGVGPITTDLDGWNVTALLSGCIARIGFTTNINQFESNTIKVFPNPTKELIHIEGIDDANSILLFDMSGKLIVQETDLVSPVIDVKDVLSGMYFISIFTSEGVFNAPIIIEH